MKYKFITMFVPISPTLTWFALCTCQLNYSDECMRQSSAHELSCGSWSEARPPPMLCAVLWPGWSTLSQVKDDFGLSSFVAPHSVEKSVSLL